MEEPLNAIRKKREIYPEIMDDQPGSLEKVTEDQSQQGSRKKKFFSEKN